MWTGEEVFRGPGGESGEKIPKSFKTLKAFKGARGVVPGTVELSLVVPAYKETERLPTMMNETVEYLAERAARTPGFYARRAPTPER